MLTFLLLDVVLKAVSVFPAFKKCYLYLIVLIILFKLLMSLIFKSAFYLTTLNIYCVF